MLVCSTSIWSNVNVLRKISHQLHYALKEHNVDKWIATHERITRHMWVIINDHLCNNLGVGSFKEVVRKFQEIYHEATHPSIALYIHSTTYSQ